MRGFRLPFLTLVGLAGSWPLPPVPPRSVSEGEEAIRHIWQSAWDGHIENILPERYGHLQGAWADFLTTQGAGIVESYYSGEFRDHMNKSVIHGRNRFLGLVQFTDRRAYGFDPVRWTHKRNVAVRLAEAFAERQHTYNLEDAALKAQSETTEKEIGEDEAVTAAKTDRERRQWGKTLSLGRVYAHSD